MDELLIRLIRESSIPMAPLPSPVLPTDLEALVYPDAMKEPVSGIRAALFDVYGTLFTSAAGDIGVPDTPEPLGLAPGTDLREFFHAQVEHLHREGSAKTAYPEVRVEEIWKTFLGRPVQELQCAEDQPPMDPREFALRYELSVNPVYPMPGALAMLRTLRKAGLVLGIISNAQFFTPLLFEAFFGETTENLGFDPELCIYSFAFGEAKPSPRLFAHARDRLRALNISPDETVYLGNDMLKDIVPAVSMGFQSLLFAGDGRSLRLRELRSVKPRGIIRRLGDLAGFLNLDAKG